MKLNALYKLVICYGKEGMSPKSLENECVGRHFQNGNSLDKMLGSS